MRTKHSGFTLIELMITVAIIGILTSIALPSYQAHVTKTQRTDAQGALSSFSVAMERYFAANNTYVGAATGGTTAATAAPAAPKTTVFANQSPLDQSTKLYNLTIQAETATTYTLRAAPITGTGQAADGIIQLSSIGLRSWDNNNDGDVDDTDEDDWK